MKVRRYFGRTNREALAKLREALGPDAVVIKNRAVGGGVEILALDESAQRGEVDGVAAATNAAAMPEAPDAEQHGTRPIRTHAANGARVPEMSTLSFQQYVRDRLAQREAAPPQTEQDQTTGPRVQRAASAAAPNAGARGTLSASGTLGAPSSPCTPTPPDALHAHVLAELREMRSFLADQFGAAAGVEALKQAPLPTALAARMLGAGYSPLLARAIAGRLPADFSELQATAWMRRVLARNLRCDAEGKLLDGGGVFALVGPTGVGKTTSTAKIAARCVLKHGVESVRLITVDAYRIGGQNQLRSFGQLLGVPVHAAHDAATLSSLLAQAGDKELVLIDTAGISQRDGRVEEMLVSIALPAVRRLLVLNATAQPETLDEVVRAYQGSQAAGVVVSKTDEAVKLGGVLDCAVRHQLNVVGVANGQRVPEDWVLPHPEALVQQALSVPALPQFALESNALELVFRAPALPGQIGAGCGHA